MKKSNIVVAAALVLLSAFLLWLWYYLGFYRIDDPFDLVLSIAWWAVIVVMIVVVTKAEHARRRRLRTVYVGENEFFLSESGSAPYVGSEQLVAAMGKALGDLKYGFGIEETPVRERFALRCLVRTEKFKDDTWSGLVEPVGEAGEPVAFGSREELADVLRKFA